MKTVRSRRVSEPQKLPKSADKHFYRTFFLSVWGKLSPKKLFLRKSETSGLLINTTADYKYSRSMKENLLLPIRMQSSEKAKNILEKKKRHTLSIFEIIDWEKRGYLNE